MVSVAAHSIAIPILCEFSVRRSVARNRYACSRTGGGCSGSQFSSVSSARCDDSGAESRAGSLLQCVVVAHAREVHAVDSEEDDKEAADEDEEDEAGEAEAKEEQFEEEEEEEEDDEEDEEDEEQEDEEEAEEDDEEHIGQYGGTMLFGRTNNSC